MHEETISPHAVLLYQAGIANVFLSNGDGRLRRVRQSDFQSCEDFAAGLIAAGIPVKVMSANVAGDADCQRDRWSDGLDDCPFRDSACPPAGSTRDVI